MKRAMLLLCVLVMSCHAPPRPAAPPATQASRSDAAQVIDAVLAGWLSGKNDNLLGEDVNPGVVLMRMNLPPGYEPKVKGFTVLVADEFIARESSYIQTVHASRPGWVVLYEGENGIGPRCIQIDKLEIQGDTARVEISQNRRFNMGASGGNILCKRTASGWVSAGGGATWVW